MPVVSNENGLLLDRNENGNAYARRTIKMQQTPIDRVWRNETPVDSKNWVEFYGKSYKKYRVLDVKPRKEKIKW